jgi:hypothetical protein
VTRYVLAGKCINRSPNDQAVALEVPWESRLASLLHLSVPRLVDPLAILRHFRLALTPRGVFPPCQMLTLVFGGNQRASSRSSPRKERELCKRIRCSEPQTDLAYSQRRLGQYGGDASHRLLARCCGAYDQVRARCCSFAERHCRPRCEGSQ